ncbi:MAG: N-acetylmuramic acid 6-phosphate etherase [Vulcanimicrobiaceae bacterium]
MSEHDAATEAVDPTTLDLDRLPVPQLVARLTAHQRVAFTAVEAAAPALAQAVDRIVAALAGGGRLHYVGAGTSGRLGALDAAELPPTFGTDPALVRAHIAGGSAALQRAVEGAEDDAAAGAALARTEFAPGDAVIGISASGRAPYVVAALATARERGCTTIGIMSDRLAPLAGAVEIVIGLATGAEAIAGSTRMAAGTAQKIALGVLSTATMVRLGRVYENAMVDLIATNAKLRARAVRLVARFTGIDDARAIDLLARAGGSVKVAIAMARRDLDAAAARAALDRAGGSLRRVVDGPTLP